MIPDRDELAATPARETALACVEAGIEAAHPRTVVRERLAVEDETLRITTASGNDATDIDLARFDELLVLGGGKAAGQVAAALESLLGDRIAGGAVVTDDPVPTDRIDVLPGDHPVPSERGVESAREVLDLAGRAGRETLVLAVVTGGASALLPAPAEGVSLAALRDATRTLLDSGADVAEINAVRKHCSALKGGRLAERATPATVVGLLFSDVVGDDHAVIGSGPTAPDDSTFGDALAVLDRYGVGAESGDGGQSGEDARPGGDQSGTLSNVRQHLERGAKGAISETPSADGAIFDAVENRVLANGFTALAAARDAADERGYDATILSSRVRGEARESARTHVAIAEEVRATGNPLSPPAVLLSGGETTVTVRGDGAGGPNLEFALSAALELDDGMAVASVDTDGRDGSTDAAGALVDGGTVGDGEAVADDGETGGPDETAARDALAENDALPVLRSAGALVRTGRTGTNVNDLRVLVVE